MYEPYTWTNGEVITAEKLNHIERGVEEADNVFVINVEQDEDSFSLTLLTSWEDINSAAESGMVLIAKDQYNRRHIVEASQGYLSIFMTSYMVAAINFASPDNTPYEIRLVSNVIRTVSDGDTINPLFAEGDDNLYRIVLNYNGNSCYYLGNDSWASLDQSIKIELIQDGGVYTFHVLEGDTNA